MHSHKILRITSANIPLQKKISQELSITPVLAQILLNRGIRNASEAEKFLNTKIEHLHSPFSFSQMDKSVELIKHAAKNKDKVMIYGDYDVDGMTSVALLKHTLKKIGIDALHYLPHRVKEGYGLNKNIVGLAKEKKIKLLITVDCGTSNHKEIAALRRNHVEVIVTDHHEPAGSVLPDASGMINPKLKDAGYPYRDLAGVGVAYKLCQALTNSLLLEDLDLVTLGTIADVVPLTGENRIITKEGLKNFPQTKRPGLQALINNAGIKDRKFTPTYISFIIGPRLNASGRMSSAETSLKLLMSEVASEAEELAKLVEAENRQRQKVEGQIMAEAEAIISKEINFKDHQVIVIAKEDWHQGVLGIVAAKLADRFYRPAIVISLNEKMCKGSGRSIKNFHLFDALVECKELLHTFGGHAHAAGLTIAKDSVGEFRKTINRLAKEKLSLEDLIPSLDIDLEVGLADLNDKVATELEMLEPYGAGNPEPLFYTRNLKIKGEPQLLSRDTLKFWVTDGTHTIQAIGFGMGGLKDSVVASDSVDLVYSPRIDYWRDASSLILEVRDIFLK